MQLSFAYLPIFIIGAFVGETKRNAVRSMALPGSLSSVTSVLLHTRPPPPSATTDTSAGDTWSLPRLDVGRSDARDTGTVRGAVQPTRADDTNVTATRFTTVTPGNTTVTINSTTTTTTWATWTTTTIWTRTTTTTPRSIYIRGHLLRAQTPSDSRQTADSWRRRHSDTTSDHKSTYGRRVVHHQKWLHNTAKHIDNSPPADRIAIYAWFVGAAALIVVCLTTLAASLVFCFCGEKLQLYWQRRRQSKCGVYQRVESVSSLVDTMDATENSVNDSTEYPDSVTMI